MEAVQVVQVVRSAVHAAAQVVRQNLVRHRVVQIAPASPETLAAESASAVTMRAVVLLAELVTAVLARTVV